MAAAGPGWTPAYWPPPEPQRPRRTCLILTLAVAGVICTVALGLAAWHLGMAIGRASVALPSRAVPPHASTCRMEPNGPPSSPLTGYFPTVVIQNRGSESLLVASISVAIFNPAGSQVASVNMVNARYRITYIGPGAFYSFTDDHGKADSAWNGTCRVEKLLP